MPAGANEEERLGGRANLFEPHDTAVQVICRPA
ncbi:hypothetical protein J2S54_001274 [Streptomyces sp. DSM 42143]|nr:hypothetical protein [Streptomyces sp. DSM 42143]